jgi:hypothetical protein
MHKLEISWKRECVTSICKSLLQNSFELESVSDEDLLKVIIERSFENFLSDGYWRNSSKE